MFGSLTMLLCLKLCLYVHVCEKEEKGHLLLNLELYFLPDMNKMLGEIYILG